MDFFGAQNNNYNYGTKELLKVIFNKIAFVKFKISNNFKQNVDETHSKQLKIHRKNHTSLWILKISRKTSENQSLKTLPNVCDSKKENHTLEYGFKNLWKIQSLANGFLFFVISISEQFSTFVSVINLMSGKVNHEPSS
jgi:hypothetical protein